MVIRKSTSSKGGVLLLLEHEIFSTVSHTGCLLFPVGCPDNFRRWMQMEGAGVWRWSLKCLVSLASSRTQVEQLLMISTKTMDRLSLKTLKQ